jgi:chaperonin GroES
VAKSILKPVGEYLLVRPDKPVDTTPGGIVMPDKAIEPRTLGELLAVGSDVGAELQAAAGCGCQVVFRTHAGEEVSFEGEDYLLLRAAEVMAVIRPK